MNISAYKLKRYKYFIDLIKLIYVIAPRQAGYIFALANMREMKNINRRKNVGGGNPLHLIFFCVAI